MASNTSYYLKATVTFLLREEKEDNQEGYKNIDSIKDGLITIDIRLEGYGNLIDPAGGNFSNCPKVKREAEEDLYAQISAQQLKFIAAGYQVIASTIGSREPKCESFIF